MTIGEIAIVASAGCYAVMAADLLIQEKPLALVAVWLLYAAANLLLMVVGRS
jgi:hypothetical protein